MDWAAAHCYNYGEALILPGMVDLHLHAPQYRFAGLGMDLPLLQWLQHYAYPEEEKYAAARYAFAAYQEFAVALRDSFTCRANVLATMVLWREVVIIPGLNTTDKELAGLKDAIGRINPDSVQLNTLDRPAAEGWVEAASDAELDRIVRVLGHRGVEITGPRPPLTAAAQVKTGTTDLIRATLHRRPSTVEDLVRTTGLAGGEVAKILGTLERAGEICSKRMARGVFYMICQKPDNEERA
jgi:hypothetical protein